MPGRTGRVPLKSCPVNELATHFLQVYAEGGEAGEGWLYGKALRQARLDHSPESLARLDALLAQIRTRARPTRAQLDSPQGRNFEALVAFYLIGMARRRTHAEIVWMARDAALAAMPAAAQVPDTPSAGLLACAPDHDAVCQPLAWVEAQVRPDGRPLAAADYIDALVARLGQDGPAEWRRMARAVGHIASFQMHELANARPALPAMATQKAPATVEVLGSGLDTIAELQRAAARGVELLEKNPGGAAWQVFSYNGFADVEGARIDSVIVFAASYGPKPMRMVVSFPYRLAAGGRRLAILRPAVREADIPVEALRKLNGPLERGIREFAWTSGASWDELYAG
jgi:hypothetical protein